MAKLFAHVYRTPGSARGTGYCVRTAADAKKRAKQGAKGGRKTAWAKGSSCADAKKKALKKLGTKTKKCKKSYAIDHRDWSGVPSGHWVIVEKTKGSRKVRRVATRPKGKKAVAYVDRRNAAACR
jgi:hypothetical protein